MITHVQNSYKYKKVEINSIQNGSGFFFHQCICSVQGRGGGTSGRAMAFSLGRPGSNPGLDFGFFQFRIAVNLFSLGVGLFLITCNRTVHTLPSSFLFPIIIYHCENYQFQANNVLRKRKNKAKKRGQERPIFKKVIRPDTREIMLLHNNLNPS